MSKNRLHGAMEFTTPPEYLDTVRRYRLNRVREQLRRKDVAGLLAFDQINTRYITDATNMQVWCMHYEARCVFVATDGPVILYDLGNQPFLAEDLPTIDEYRTMYPIYFFWSGNYGEDSAKMFADEIADLVFTYGSGNRRLAMDRCNPPVLNTLVAKGLDIVGGQDVMERARVIKSLEEVGLMKNSIAVCEKGVSNMRAAMRPGITETALWSKLHETNIAFGGEWIEGRLLTSGPRTNPWMHECSQRVIERGDMVSFDTDLIGPYGYCCDMSRSWICGDEKPTSEQSRLYTLAAESIQYNKELIKPGIAFREMSEKFWKIPDEYFDNRYGVVVHGVGLVDEYPAIKYGSDFEDRKNDEVIEAGMTLCVEAFIGSKYGGEGVKLEEMVLVTESGVEQLTSYPLESWCEVA